MKIQQYSELITLVAKIEMKKGELAESNQALDLISDEMMAAQKAHDAEKCFTTGNEWLEAHDGNKKIQRALNKLYKEFRVKIDTDELRHIAHWFTYASDKSDREFYACARYELLKEASHIEYETGR